ncbi:MAG: hypothetical protein KAS95_08570, partial [Candidatus Heimdallarchaeota archaeon]|nr:hypothetical protein [Candidatus Heimdallarchaeota archaeon]
ITKMKPDWTDGYTKNAFHRRKIKTISDFVKKDSEDLILIKELERVLFSRFLDFLIKNTDSIKLSKLPISNLKEFQGDVKATLNELANNNINTLAELVKLQSHEIEEDSYYLFASLLLKESKTIILNHLNETQQSHDISHLKIIPHRIEMGLKKNQIFSTSSFLAHSFVKLKKMGFKKKDINDIKKQLGTQIPSWLKSKDMLKTLGITILEELFYNTTSEFTLSKDEKKQYEETIIILRKPLTFGLPELRNYSNLLNKVGINCIGRFLLWPVSELMEILNLNKEEIQVLKDKLSPKTIKQNADKYGKSLSSLVRFFPKLVKYFETHNLTIQDLFYIYISEKRALNSDYWKKINKLNEFSQADITELTNLIVLKSKKKTDFQEALLKLKMRNIRTIKQFLNSHPNVIETELTFASERKIALEILYKMQNGEIEGSDAFQKQMLLVCEFDAFQQCLNFP